MAVDQGSTYRSRHLALEVQDLEKSILFYQSAFGMQVLRRRANPVRNDIAAYVGFGGESQHVSIELYQYLHVSPSLDVNRGSHIAFAVKGIEHVFKRAIAAGATSKIIPQNNRPNSINMFAFIHDPDGHEIELTENS